MSISENALYFKQIEIGWIHMRIFTFSKIDKIVEKLLTKVTHILHLTSFNTSLWCCNPTVIYRIVMKHTFHFSFIFVYYTGGSRIPRRRGRQPSRKGGGVSTQICQILPKKLHEIKKILVGEGRPSRIRHCYSLDIPLNTPQEHQSIRTFAIFQKFLTLKIVWWSIEKFTFSSIQPISVKISGKYIYIYRKRYGDLTYVETFMDPIRMIQIFMVFHQLLILSTTWLCTF